MKKFIFMMIILLSFNLMSCTTKVGNQKLFDEVYRNRVVIGDTLVKVIELFGQPKATTKSKKSNTSTVSYVYAKSGFGKSKGGSITLIIENGKVINIQVSKVNN